MSIQKSIHDKLDELITNDPMSYPNKREFTDPLVDFLGELVTEGHIEYWSIVPSVDGLKVLYSVNGQEEQVLRNSEGGKE